MVLETRGTIKFDPDVKAGDAEYIVECKPLGICAGGSGDLEGMISDLTEQVRVAISEEFHIPRCDVQMTRYAMTCTFDVSAPVHRTLDQFIDLAQKPGSEKILETAEKIMEISKITGKNPQEVFDQAKIKLDSQKKKGTKEKGVS